MKRVGRLHVRTHLELALRGERALQNAVLREEKGLQEEDLLQRHCASCGRSRRSHRTHHLEVTSARKEDRALNSVISNEQEKRPGHH